MFKQASDYLIFASIVFTLCAVIYLVITQVWIHNIIKKNSASKDRIVFHMSQWNKINRTRSLIPVFAYIFLFVLFAIFELSAVIVILSVFLILDYFRESIISMKYVQTNVLDEMQAEN